MPDFESRLRTTQLHYDAIAPQRRYWKQKNHYYHAALLKIYSDLVPAGSRILELGCGTGELLTEVKPSIGVGLDLSGQMLKLARKDYPNMHFVVGDAEALSFAGTFDFILMSELIGHLSDVQGMLAQLRPLCHERTQIILSYYNFIWEPLI